MSLPLQISHFNRQEHQERQERQEHQKMPFLQGEFLRFLITFRLAEQENGQG